MDESELTTILNRCDAAALKIVLRAYGWAMQRRHWAAGSEHILLAAIDSNTEIVDQLLSQASLDRELIRRDLEKLLASAKWSQDLTNQPVAISGFRFLPSALLCLQEAYSESVKSKTTTINTKHLLIGCAKTCSTASLAKEIETIRSIAI